MQNPKCMIHVVEPGDTLYRLSRKYRVGLTAILYANPFVDVYNMQVGDEICIPRADGWRMEENRREEIRVQP